jgi:hypothetical protein
MFEGDGEGGTAPAAVVAAYVGTAFAVGGGLAVGVDDGVQRIGLKVMFGVLAAGLAVVGIGVWWIWFSRRRSARR